MRTTSHNPMPKNPKTGVVYNTIRDYRGNLISYDTVEEMDDYPYDKIKIHHELVYDDNDNKIKYIDSTGTFSYYYYNEGNLVFFVNGNTVNGIYTEHYCDNNGNEIYTDRVTIDGYVKRTYITNNNRTETFRIPFIRLYTNELVQ